jgi:hypothetical protein
MNANWKLNLGLSLVVGLLGGYLSRYFTPNMVHAAQIAPPTQVQAQSFLLVHADGSPAGLFGFDLRGRPDVILYDNTGKVVWTTRGVTNPKPLGVSTEK